MEQKIKNLHLAQIAFEANKGVDELYQTPKDGQCFYSEHNASVHAKEIGGTVNNYEKIKRGDCMSDEAMQQVADAEASENTQSDEAAKAKAEAEEKAAAEKKEKEAMAAAEKAKTLAYKKYAKDNKLKVEDMNDDQKLEAEIAAGIDSK